MAMESKTENQEMRQPPKPHEVDANKSASGNLVVQATSGTRYEILADGIYQIQQKQLPVKLCDAMQLVAHTRNADGSGWGIWVRFDDADGRRHDLVLPRGLLTQGRKVEERLTSEGLYLSYLSGNSSKCPLAEFLNAVPKDAIPRALSVSGGGYASDKLESFVFANETLTLPGAEAVRLLEPDTAAVLEERGTLEDWQYSVSMPAKHSSRLMFGLCVSLAAPLLEVVGVPSSIFHFWGRRGSGKTSILRAAASVYGGEDRLLSWNATGNGLEGLAIRYSNQPLILDEIGQAKESAVNAVYDLCNETARVRMDRNARLRKVNRWSLNVISSGEFSLTEVKQQKARYGSNGTASGELVRCIGIPADAGSGLGVLESLPSTKDLSGAQDSTGKRAGEFVKAFSSLKATGCAGRAYLMALMADVKETGVCGFRQQLESVKQMLEEAMTKDGEPELKDSERRVLERFAVVALAGELATSYGVMGTAWAKGDAVRAVLICFKAWRESEESPEGREQKTVQKILEAPCIARGSFLLFECDKLGAVRAVGQEPKLKASGFVILENGNDTATQIAAVYLTAQFNALCEEYGGGLSRREILVALEKAGLLFWRGNDAKHWGQLQLRRDLIGIRKGKWCYVVMPDSSTESRSRVERFFKEAKNVRCGIAEEGCNAR